MTGFVPLGFKGPVSYKTLVRQFVGFEPQYENTTVKVCEEKKPTSLQVWQSVASTAHTRVLVVIVVDLKDK